MAELEAELGLHGLTQMAVGQRVTAFHPKERYPSTSKLRHPLPLHVIYRYCITVLYRYLSTGTVLTPDGDHYKVQFDRPRLGVQLVRDVYVMPLLDGSRGIDFTSPRSAGPTDTGMTIAGMPWAANSAQEGRALASTGETDETVVFLSMWMERSDAYGDAPLLFLPRVLGWTAAIALT